jgi:hypothetical protein
MLFRLPDPPLRVLTWHVHGNYLYYLAHCHHELYVPVGADGEGSLGSGFDWPPNLHEIPVDKVRDTEFDVVLFQHRGNWDVDQHAILSKEQRSGPRVYLEHDPPREHATDTRHWVDDPDVLLVHVTHFNALMWDSGRTPTRVIEHGVVVPADARYTGELERGVVVINGLPTRGRRLGLDVFQRAAERVPLDLIGMESEAIGGLGAVVPRDLPRTIAPYRFFFSPIRYTSLGLAVIEAMAVGLPIIGLATTELPTVIDNGVSGYVATDVEALIGRMEELLADPQEARRLGQGARRTAMERFGIERFAADWDALLLEAAGRTAGADQRAAVSPR